MGQNFLLSDRDQSLLLPPSLLDWMGADALVWVVIDALEQMDLRELERRYRADGRGGAAYNPTGMLALLLYCYCKGVRSSRQIEDRCEYDVACRVIMCQLVPDHCTICLLYTSPSPRD